MQRRAPLDRLPYRRLALALALFVLGAAQACANEKQISAADAMPAGAVETAVPQVFANGVPGLNVSEMWMKGFTWDQGWDAAVQHIAAVAQAHGYHKTTTPDIPNIEKIGLTKEQVYQFWLSPNGNYGLGLMNFKLMRDRGGSFDGTAEYMLFCGGGMVTRK